jgi:hypothetical protein
VRGKPTSVGVQNVPFTFSNVKWPYHFYTTKVKTLAPGANAALPGTKKACPHALLQPL